MRSFWKNCVMGAAAALVFVGSGRAADLRISGTGATFPAPLYAKWVEAFNKANAGVVVDYQATGSGAGIKGITDRTVAFGASDAPMNAEQEKATPAHLLHLPMVAGPAVLIYNVPGVEKLTLNSAVIAGIYLKNIRMWNDGKIAALNPGVKLPAAPIAVVHRSDGSGTTFIFTDYLSKANADWKTKVGKGTTVQWPVGLGGQGNPGVATNVKNTVGGIGYVEWAYATNEKLPYASLVNKDGKEVSASIAGVEAASAAALKEFPSDFKVSIVDAPGADSYPICGFTYILVYDDLSYMKDKAMATALVNYLNWCATEGQAMAPELGYAKLPKDAQEKVVEAIKGIKFEGQAVLK